MNPLSGSSVTGSIITLFRGLVVAEFEARARTAWLTADRGFVARRVRSLLSAWVSHALVKWIGAGLGA
jgi:hypothetical protein